MSDVYLWDTYEKVGREALERKDYEQAIEAYRAAVTVAERIAGQELRLVMSLRHLSDATSKAGQLSLAHDLLRRTDEIAVSRLGASHAESVQVKRAIYELARQLGHLDEAEAYLVEVMSTVKAHGETAEFLEVMELLASLASERGELESAATIYKELAEARGSLYGADHPSVAQALLWHSTALSQVGQGAAAEESLTQAFDMLEKQFADDPKNLAQSLLAGAELMVQGGRMEAALEHQKRALDLLSSIYDDEHPSLWDTRELIAATLAGLGRLEESIELLEYCLKHRKDRDHRSGGMLKNLAGLYLTLQKVDKAEELYQQAADLLNLTLGPEHPASLATTEERIQLYHFTGRPQQALDLALTTIRPTEQRYGGGHPNTAQVYASTAVLAHAAKNWDTAYELMKAAEQIWDTLIPKPADVLSNCRLNMATCLVELGRNAEAAILLNRVEAPPGSPVDRVVKELWNRLESDTPAASGSPDDADEEPEPASDPVATSDPEPGDSPLPEDDSTPTLALSEELTDGWEPPTEVMPWEGAEPQPDGELRLVREPEAIQVEPETAQVELESAPVEPEAAPVEPESAPVELETASVRFEFSSAPLESESDPAEASAEPPLPPTTELDAQGLPEIEPDLPSEELSPQASESADASETSYVDDEDSEEDEPYLTGAERRLYPRFNLGLNRFFDLAIRTAKGESSLVRCFLVDLSAGGLRVNSEHPLPVKETFQVTVPADLVGEEMEMSARVTWQRALFGTSYIQGVEFLSISEEQRGRISSKLDDSDLHSGGRQHFRLYRPFPIQLAHAEHEDWMNSLATDLSVEGLGTRLGIPIAAGETVRLRLSPEFELPTVEVSATVAWSRSGDNGVSHGLRFDEMGPVEARTIRLYIDRALELSPD